MRHSYRGLLSLPGARALVVSGLPARLPIAAYGIGLLALVREDYGSYAAGGVVAAAYTVTTMVAGLLTGRWCGRSWYRSALGWLSGLQLVTLACLVAWSALAYPLWILCVNAAGLGLLVPPAGVLVRASWSTLVGSREELDTALYLEGAFDEAAFIVGPMLIAGAGLVLGPPAALLSVGVITSAGCLALAVMPGGFGPPAPARQPRRRLFTGPFSLQCVAFAALGGAFGCVQVACFAFAREHGEPWHAGPVLTAFSAVSLAAGVVGGVLPRSGPPGRRHQAMLVLLCLGLLPALMAGGPVGLAVLLVPAACAASPAVATGFASAGSIAGPERLAEAFAWCAAALGAGLAVGTALAGTVADAAGSRAVLLAGSALAAAGALAAWGGLRLSASNALHLVGDSRGGAAVSLARPGVRE